MNTDTPIHPSGASRARHTHHWTLGPLPRILFLATVVANIGVDVWLSASAPSYTDYRLWPSILFAYIPGLVLAWAANPGEGNRVAIAGVWITLVGYIASNVGGSMIGQANLTGSGWYDPWYGPGEAIMVTGWFLFLVGIVAYVVGKLSSRLK